TTSEIPLQRMPGRSQTPMPRALGHRRREAMSRAGCRPEDPAPASAGPLPGRPQALCRLDDAFGETGLRGLAPDPRVVHLLVPDLVIDLQNAVVITEHVVSDGTCEGVLGVSVDVHLHHAIVDRVGDLLLGRART